MKAQLELARKEATKVGTAIVVAVVCFKGEVVHL